MKLSELREVRISKDLTQEQLSEMAGINRPFYTQIETGKRNPSLKTMKKLAEVLQVNIEI